MSSATAAGEAERMAAGVKLGAEQDVGVSLAWIGVVSGDESHRSTLTARALFDDADGGPNLRRASTSPSEVVGSRSTYPHGIG